MLKKCLLISVMSLAGCAHHTVKPGTIHYPRHAWALNVEGEVDVMYDINDDGTTSDVHMIREQPTGFFALTVVREVQQWKYTPHHPKKHVVLHVRFEKPQLKYTTAK